MNFIETADEMISRLKEEKSLRGVSEQVGLNNTRLWRIANKLVDIRVSELQKIVDYYSQKEAINESHSN